MTKLLFIRPARPEEQDALEALRSRAVLAAEAYRGHPPAQPSSVRIGSARFADNRVLVVEGEEGLFGFAVWTRTRDGIAELEGLFVEPDRWRQGMGRRLLDAVTAQIRGAPLRVTVGPGEMPFFDRCGFVKTRKVETRSGPAIRMERRREDTDSSTA